MNIILFGGTGMLGAYLLKILAMKHNVRTITRKEYDIASNNNEKLSNLIESSPCDIIINSAGAIPQKYDTSDCTTFAIINTFFPHLLSKISNKKGCKLIHISTDCVFDGKKGNYSEKDVHTETGMYGVSKSLGEPQSATIIRTSIIGEDSNSQKGLLEWLISMKNKQVDGYKDHYWNGITCLTLANIIDTIIDQNLYWKGVRHIFSPDTKSKYDLCKIINDIYSLNLDIRSVEKGYTNRILTSIYSLNIPIKTIKEQIEEQKTYNIKQTFQISNF